MPTTEDPYRITGSLPINAILQQLIKNKLLLRLRADNHPEAIITTLLEANPKQGVISIGLSANSRANQRLLNAQTIAIDSIIDDISIEFSINLSPDQVHVNQQQQSLSLPFPEVVRRIQRREYFRVETLVSNPVFCEIPDLASGPAKFPVKNISAGGLALIDREQLIQHVGQQFEHCVLELDGIGNLIVNLSVVRIDSSSEHEKSHVIACQFTQPKASTTVMLQNYVNRLQRLINARQRGLD